MKTRIVLETGCNHQGDINIALKMIDDAARLNVWGVKFQKRDIDSIPEEVGNIKRDLRNSFGETYREHRAVLEFEKETLKTLKVYAEEKGLKFLCSAFDEKSIEDLIEIKCQYIKLPSQLYSDPKIKDCLLKYKKDHKFDILLSTGMHSYEEIVNNDWLKNAQYIFHCISVYPHYVKEMNLIFLNCLSRLSSKYGFIPGYSSHDQHGAGIFHAVLAGAEIIERHYTLDKTMKGSDHRTVSSDYAEMSRIIREIEDVEQILGDPERICSEKEKAIRKIYRGF